MLSHVNNDALGALYGFLSVFGGGILAGFVVWWIECAERRRNWRSYQRERENKTADEGEKQ